MTAHSFNFIVLFSLAVFLFFITVIIFLMADI